MARVNASYEWLQKGYLFVDDAPMQVSVFEENFEKLFFYKIPLR